MAKILVVDDEEQVRALLRVQLEAVGHTIEEAANAHEALGKHRVELYKNVPFDLILLDILMLGPDGKGVFDIIRKDESSRQVKEGEGVPIIMLTGTKHKFMDEFNLPCDDYMLKPYEADALIQKIDEKLNLKK